uniref:Uncharacterized protein n=1 Tax=Anguilla anguilla TaxID=7936 RepID=A0A0E9QWH6_ANGAN
MLSTSQFSVFSSLRKKLICCQCQECRQLRKYHSVLSCPHTRSRQDSQFREDIGFADKRFDFDHLSPSLSLL